MENPEKVAASTRGTSSPRQMQILGLDLVRSIAALLVMLHHYFGSLPLWVPAAELGSYSLALLPYTWFGWVGVQIFFVISGFVIAYSASRTTPARFARSRFLRLYPTLWICATVTLAASLLAHTDSNHMLIHDWMHSVIIDPRQTPYIDGSYWTLPIEISFYVLIFALLWTRAFRHVGAVLTCLGLVSTGYIVYRFGAEAGMIDHLAIADLCVHWIEKLSAPSTLIRFGVYFTLGTELWLFLFERKTLWRLLLLLIFVLSGALGIYSYGLDFIASLRHAGVYGPLSPQPAIVIWLLSLAVIVASVTFNEEIAKATGRRAAKIIRNLGLATYPIYLLHQVIGHIVIRKLHGDVPDGLSAMALIVSIPAFCMTVLPRIESPLHERLRGWLGAPGKAGDGSVSAAHPVENQRIVT